MDVQLSLSLLCRKRKWLNHPALNRPKTEIASLVILVVNFDEPTSYQNDHDSLLWPPTVASRTSFTSDSTHRDRWKNKLFFAHLDLWLMTNTNVWVCDGECSALPRAPGFLIWGKSKKGPTQKFANVKNLAKGTAHWGGLRQDARQLWHFYLFQEMCET